MNFGVLIVRALLFEKSTVILSKAKNLLCADNQYFEIRRFTQKD